MMASLIRVGIELLGQLKKNRKSKDNVNDNLDLFKKDDAKKKPSIGILNHGKL